MCPGNQYGSGTLCSAYTKTYDCANFAYFIYDKKERTTGVALIIAGFVLILSFAAWARLKMAAHFRKMASERQRNAKPQTDVQNVMNAQL
jgi:hypothetical protein